MQDSNEAYQIFEADPTMFDLVITDQTMPNLSGIELSKKILAIRPETPIIMCTGYSEAVDDAKAQQVGISMFMMKPVERSLLSHAIKKTLNDTPSKIK
jgi:DNA-binding NtrC family response regulator